MKLGIAGAAILALGGGAVAVIQPAWRDGKLLAPGQRVFAALGRAFLDGSLPEPAVQRAQALAAFLVRVDALIANLPGHAQQELAQLVALLALPAGRVGLAGLSPDWDTASNTEIQDALQGMRLSSLALRQQAYQALHDITGGAYFSAETTWPVLGYPGPLDV